MSNYDDEMIKAYFKCLSPSDIIGSDYEGYVLLTDLMFKDMETLLKLLPAEHHPFVEQCYDTMHMYINLCSEYYFKAGWRAAKEDNKLDHY